MNIEINVRILGCKGRIYGYWGAKIFVRVIGEQGWMDMVFLGSKDICKGYW
jgi:hypothetical protein